MKKDIHPKYHKEAKAKCACGQNWTTGSTSPEINIEICGGCHPFYTGKDKKVDTQGRIERYTKRKEKAEAKT